MNIAASVFLGFAWFVGIAALIPVPGKEMSSLILGGASAVFLMVGLSLVARRPQ